MKKEGKGGEGKGERGGRGERGKGRVTAFSSPSFILSARHGRGDVRGGRGMRGKGRGEKRGKGRIGEGKGGL